ncbi:MAG TPA: hypothetical protein VEH04_04635 [Verrucomicrobiae bacterium]|nr:hypothetical protein [Verrucomicrobiae bacterium]
MNEHDETSRDSAEQFCECGAFVSREVSQVTAGSAQWFKRVLACNPFYLVSAALLLFGVYKVSTDPQLAAREFSQLQFNFGSLQFYELLLVGTAIFLARRKVWYDSTLLVTLENLLLLVPFILISHAALMDSRTVGWMSVLGVGLVLMRFGALRRWFGQLNLPPRALIAGGLILTVNVIWLWVYRDLQEERTPVWGPAHEMHEWSWLLILPALLMLGGVLPIAKEVGRSLLPQHRWLPFGFFGLWIAGTAVHLYSLTYMYDFVLRRELLAPSLCVLAWLAAWRTSDFLKHLHQGVSRTLLTLPLIAALVAGGGDVEVLMVLAGANAVVYAAFWMRRDARFVRHLLFASLVMLGACLPSNSFGTLPRFDRPMLLSLAVGCYLVLWTALSRQPKAGVLGALLCAISAMFCGRDVAGIQHVALQLALVFLLVHSVRWDDMLHDGARAVRTVAAILWVAHALVWVHAGASGWMTCTFSIVVVIACAVVRIFRGRWEFQILLTSAVLVGLAGPGHVLVGVMRSAPGGMLAILGSFLLFAIGTGAALIKHRWHESQEKGS